MNGFFLNVCRVKTPQKVADFVIFSLISFLKINFKKKGHYQQEREKKVSNLWYDGGQEVLNRWYTWEKVLNCRVAGVEAGLRSPVQATTSVEVKGPILADVSSKNEQQQGAWDASPVACGRRENQNKPWPFCSWQGEVEKISTS